MNEKIYAFRIKEKAELLKSSSGGAFTALSNYFLDNQWPILCSLYNYESKQMEFSLIHSKTDRDKCRGSKYFQSKPLNSYKDAIKYLKNNRDKQLLFVGMGCQAEGFRKLAELSGVRDRTTIVDIICTGVPSPKLWKEYVSNKGNVEYLTFKDKRNGWNSPTAFVQVNGVEEPIDDFVKLFYSHLALRPSCYECSFAKIERNIDITIGDFWHIEDSMPDFKSNDGNSLVIAHTEKGLEIFNQIKDNAEWRESNSTDCMQNMLNRPTPRPEMREKFWKDYYKKGISYVMKKYLGISIVTKLKGKIHRMVDIIFAGGGVQTNISSP